MTSVRMTEDKTASVRVQRVFIYTEDKTASMRMTKSIYFTQRIRWQACG